MHSVLGDGVVGQIDDFEVVGFQNRNKFHYSIDAQPHRVQVQHVGVFFRVYLVVAFLEHFPLLQVGFFPRVLTPRHEQFFVSARVP